VSSSYYSTPTIEVILFPLVSPSSFLSHHHLTLLSAPAVYSSLRSSPSSKPITPAQGVTRCHACFGKSFSLFSIVHLMDFIFIAYSNYCLAYSPISVGAILIASLQGQTRHTLQSKTTYLYSVTTLQLMNLELIGHLIRDPIFSVQCALLFLCYLPRFFPQHRY